MKKIFLSMLICMIWTSSAWAHDYYHLENTPTGTVFIAVKGNAVKKCGIVNIEFIAQPGAYGLRIYMDNRRMMDNDHSFQVKFYREDFQGRKHQIEPWNVGWDYIQIGEQRIRPYVAATATPWKYAIIIFVPNKSGLLNSHTGRKGE